MSGMTAYIGATTALILHLVAASEQGRWVEVAPDTRLEPHNDIDY